jgi:hypothetical protein
MVKFFKMIQDNDMYAIVRIGPFIQAEWNHGLVCVASSSHSVAHRIPIDLHKSCLIICTFFFLFPSALCRFFFQRAALLAEGDP